MKLVVGIPTKNEVATIAAVTATVDLGLSASFPAAQTFIVNADNGSADGTSDAFRSVPTNAEKVVVNTAMRMAGAGMIGKGTNVFAVLEFAVSIGADAVCLIDGDLRSAQPEWINLLINASLRSEDATFVTPEYTRSRYEANSTNQLVVPYLRAAFGLDIRQPIGGEFAMNAALVAEALTWSRAESTELYGIDVWLTVNSALRNLNLEQVHIGRKVHNPTFPKIFLLGQQVLDALFRLMLEHRPATPGTAQIDSVHDVCVDVEGVRLSTDLVDPVVRRASDYVHTHWDDLVFTFPALVGQRLPQPGVLPHIDTEDWCQILAQAYLQLDGNSFRRVRDHLVGLFPARVTSYWREIEGMTADEVDVLLSRQSQQLAELFGLANLPDRPVSTAHDPLLLAGAWSTELPEWPQAAFRQSEEV